MYHVQKLKIDYSKITKSKGNSLAVQWLGLRTFTAEGTGSIPGQGTKIPQAAWCGQKKVNRYKRILNNLGNAFSKFVAFIF